MNYKLNHKSKNLAEVFGIPQNRFTEMYLEIQAALAVMNRPSDVIEMVLTNFATDNEKLMGMIVIGDVLMGQQHAAKLAMKYLQTYFESMGLKDIEIKIDVRTGEIEVEGLGSVDKDSLNPSVPGKH